MNKQMVAHQVHHFCRTYPALVLPGNVAYAPYQSAFVTQLSFLPGVSDFTNLYDQYKISFVKFMFYLEIDPSAQAAGTARFPKLYYARDQDDSNIESMEAMRKVRM